MGTKRANAAAFAAGALVLACAAAIQSPGQSRETGRLTLGVFDSRAVALAYADSEYFDSYFTDFLEQLEHAKSSGDVARVSELEAFGPKLQRQLHEQAFSTGSVDNILEHIQAQLPDLADQAGVDVIVSRWDLVYRSPPSQAASQLPRPSPATPPAHQSLRQLCRGKAPWFAQAEAWRSHGG
jgi:hypothetical protein